ncbi:hypothetical protein ZIOFF_059148 [Zingiber officinale]|uniref:DUF569 domain-containing protein n=1 Tax=Zingiber officinale TaxID=94328 RepID=A0A8J5F4J1_ZINOF|nr:hypothetical protein ZIOFF_059148 [Zingiber officinale]
MVGVELFAIGIASSHSSAWMRFPMDSFARAKTVRLRSYQEKYLAAEDDGEHVSQKRDSSGLSSLWAVELVDDAPHGIRLRSSLCGRYLTATDESHLFGVNGKKVRLTLPPHLDSSLEWEPSRDGAQIKLKNRYGSYLRGNRGPRPWRNSVTHDVPHLHHDWILWSLEIAEPLPTETASPTSSDAESSPSPSGYLHKVEDRSIFYAVADDEGNVDDSVEWPAFTFNGTSVPELTEKLKEKTHLADIVVCARNPLNHQLIPLLLQLPPNNATMRLVIVEAHSRAAKKFDLEKEGFGYS